MNEIKPLHNLMLILLSNLTGNESDEELYNKTRFAWRTKLERAKNVDYVIAHDSDENIVAIYKPHKWLKADDKEFKSLKRDSNPNRVGFVGELASSDIQEIYADCLTPARKKGAANPVRYLSPVDDDELDDDIDYDALEADLDFDNDDDFESESNEPSKKFSWDDIDDSDSDNSSSDNETDEIKHAKHTYLAGAAAYDDSFDNLVEVAYQFVETAYYKFSDQYKVYLILRDKAENINYLDDVSVLRLTELFEGSYDKDDEAPSKDEIRKTLKESSNFQIFDEGYMMLWFLFEFPEEDEDDWTQEPGDNWKYTFLQLAKDFDAFTMIGYHSGMGDNIWQQWGEGDYDEGAISNSDVSDHYMGDNLETIHKVDLKCLDIKNFEII